MAWSWAAIIKPFVSNFSPAVLSHPFVLLAYIFLAYSVWVLPIHLFLFLVLLNLVLSMTLCIFLHFPWLELHFQIAFIREVELSSKNFCLIG